MHSRHTHCHDHELKELKGATAYKKDDDGATSEDTFYTFFDCIDRHALIKEIEDQCGFGVL